MKSHSLTGVDENVLVLGTGAMMSALLIGSNLTSPSKKTSTIKFYLYNPTASKAQALADSLGENYEIVSKEHLGDISKKVSSIWLGMKPQVLKAQLSEFKKLIESSHHLVTILASLDSSFYFEHFNPSRLTRLMPNVGVRTGHGVTLAYVHSKVKMKNFSERDWVLDFFASTGVIHFCQTEKELDLLTLLSGCGPAYFFKLVAELETAMMNLLITEGIDHLTQDTLRELTLGTLEGALTIAQSKVGEMNTLIDLVCSKGGVTEKVLEQWRLKFDSPQMEQVLKSGHERLNQLK